MLDVGALIKSESFALRRLRAKSFDLAIPSSKVLSKPSVNKDIMKINVKTDQIRPLRVCSSSEARSLTIEMCQNHIRNKTISPGWSGTIAGREIKNKLKQGFGFLQNPLLRRLTQKVTAYIWWYDIWVSALRTSFQKHPDKNGPLSHVLKADCIVCPLH